MKGCGMPSQGQWRRNNKRLSPRLLHPWHFSCTSMRHREKLNVLLPVSRAVRSCLKRTTKNLPLQSPPQTTTTSTRIKQNWYVTQVPILQR